MSDTARRTMQSDPPASTPTTRETVRLDTDRILSEIAGGQEIHDPFAAAVHATRMPMIITDPRQHDNPILFVNDAFCRLTGYDRAEIIGHNCRFLQGPGTDQTTVTRIRDAIAAREKIEIAIFNYRKDGTPFWNQLLLAPVKDANGEVAYFFASQYDITADFAQLNKLKSENVVLAAEREANAERLLASQERFQTVLQAIDTAYAVVEVRFDADDRPIDYRFLEANPAFERQAGVNLRGKWVTEFAPDLERFWFETYGHVARTGEPANFENYAEAFRRWFDVKAIRIGDPADRQIAIFFNDVTARKIAEGDLHRLNETLEQQVLDRTQERDRLWRNTQDIQVIIDGQGIFKAVNPAFTTILGWTAEDVLGKAVFDFVLSDDEAATDRALQIARAKTLPTVENRYSHKDGGFRWISWVAAPEGDLIYASGRHITADKERAETLRQTEEALRQSQKMEAVGQLTGGVAHDFNNMLTIIRSSVDFLRRPDLPEARRTRYMDAVSDTVDRAAKLTGQLLAFARRQALNPEVLNVGERLQGIGQMLDTVTGTRVQVTTEVPDAPCFVRVDVSQFETALVNLAVNARDAMDGEGELVLRLVCGVSMPPIRGHGGGPGPFAKIALSDTGSGIAEADLARIFEPFFTTKEVGKGTGLGLSQVFGFAKQSGGDIEVASEVDRGTTFTLYLPEVEAVVETDVDDEETGPAPRGNGQRVLVVEDNLEVGKFAMQILEDLGYRTEWVTNAESALDRLGHDGDGFEAVFSDVVMPGMGGIGLAQELRKRLPKMPVVLTSGYSHVLAENDAHGFELLHKPYSADQLSRILRRVTRTRRSRR